MQFQLISGIVIRKFSYASSGWKKKREIGKIIKNSGSLQKSTYDQKPQTIRFISIPAMSRYLCH